MQYFLYQDIKYKLFKLTNKVKPKFLKLFLKVLRYANLENCEGGNNTDSSAKIRV